jgi:hypothetical protein
MAKERKNQTAQRTMPAGQIIGPIEKRQVTTTEGDAAAPVYTEDAVASLVWENFNRARNYVENNAWLLNWQETDILYQSPTPDRFTRVQGGRPARVSRFLIAKFTRTLARAVKRAIFAEQIPFLLRPVGKETQDQVDAWTALLAALLKRMDLPYHVGLLINTQVLQGTGIGRMGWEEREVKLTKRVRKAQPQQQEMPDGSKKEIPTVESDEFDIVDDGVKIESWPFFEYRRLGTTLFDPKWCTPDRPADSSGYAIDVDYVNFADLQRMREMDCYQKIPSDEVLKDYFFQRRGGDAPVGSQIEDQFAAQGSMVTHAEGRNRQTDASPIEQDLMILEQWDGRTVKTILCYDGRRLTIRNEDHHTKTYTHVAATWWPIDNCGYGLGIGRLCESDQRINQGIINESLKTIAYPFNAPILIRRGDNAPTQNTIWRMGGFQQVDVEPGEDVRKGMAFMPMPQVPADAWKFLEGSMQSGEDLSGANAPFQQGNLGGPGSSAARTATGAGRIASMSDQNIADPVDSVADGVIVPVIKFLMEMVKEKMPLSEIREILSEKHYAIIETAVLEEQFLDCDFEVTVLAGQKLATKQGIQQLLPVFLQIFQQPQLLEFLHNKGETIDFREIMDLMIQVSDLMMQPKIFVPLSPQEKEMVKQMNPAAQKAQSSVAVEQQKGANQKEAIQTKGQVDLATTAAKIAMERTADGIPLERAGALVERGADEKVLENGLPDTEMQ